MGESSVQVFGEQTGPVQHELASKTVTFSLFDKYRHPFEFQLFSHNFIRLLRFREPKQANAAEWEEVIAMEFTSDAFKIRGNKEALDTIQRLNRNGELCLVRQCEGVDPDRAEGLGEPVVYSITLLPRVAGKGCVNLDPYFPGPDKISAKTEAPGRKP